MVAQHESVVLQLRAASGGVDHDRRELTRGTRRAQILNQSRGKAIRLVAPAQMMCQAPRSSPLSAPPPNRPGSAVAGWPRASAGVSTPWAHPSNQRDATARGCRAAGASVCAVRGVAACTAANRSMARSGGCKRHGSAQALRHQRRASPSATRRRAGNGRIFASAARSQPFAPAACGRCARRARGRDR